MEYNKIIILLLIVIIALLIAGFMILGPFAKGDTNLSITTNTVLYDGDNFGISLVGSDGKPIANARVDVKIIDANGTVNPQVITTDEKGEGLLQLKGLTPGNYVINVTYGGDNSHNGNNTSQNVEIKGNKTVDHVGGDDKATNDNENPSYANKIKTHYNSQSGGSVIDLSGLSEDEYAQYLGYSDADEMNRETERKRAEARSRN